MCSPRNDASRMGKERERKRKRRQQLPFLETICRLYHSPLHVRRHRGNGSPPNSFGQERGGGSEMHSDRRRRRRRKVRLATDRRHYQEGGREAMHAAGFVQKERRGILLSTFFSQRSWFACHLCFVAPFLLPPPLSLHFHALSFFLLTDYE